MHNTINLLWNAVGWQSSLWGWSDVWLPGYETEKHDFTNWEGIYKLNDVIATLNNDSKLIHVMEGGKMERRKREGVKADKDLDFHEHPKLATLIIQLGEHLKSQC